MKFLIAIAVVACAACAYASVGYGAGVPLVSIPKSYGVIVGGDRGAGAAYRYRNGQDNAAINGFRQYDHNAGYGWAKESDAAAPHASVWGRQYDSAQSSSWGLNAPQSYKVPYGGYGKRAW